MGIGDALMAAGEARRLHKSNKLPVMIVDPRGRPLRSPVWDGVPYIMQARAAGRPFTRLMNCGGHRPYIAAKSVEKWTWRPYKPIPAEVAFTAAEKAFAEPFRGMVMLEPSVKDIGHRNKDWGPIYWSQLDCLIHGLRIPTVQCGPAGTRPLLYTKFVQTDTFRLAAAVLSVCKAFVGTEGGLMHAAAAVGTPAVIIWSEYISPDITGYPTMRNLRHAGKPCGRRVDCEGCRQSLTAITPAMVLDNLKEILNG